MTLVGGGGCASEDILAPSLEACAGPTQYSEQGPTLLCTIICALLIVHYYLCTINCKLSIVHNWLCTILNTVQFSVGRHNIVRAPHYAGGYCNISCRVRFVFEFTTRNFLRENISFKISESSSSITIIVNISIDPHSAKCALNCASLFFGNSAHNKKIWTLTGSSMFAFFSLWMRWIISCPAEVLAALYLPLVLVSE